MTRPEIDLFSSLRDSNLSVVVPVFNEAHRILDNMQLLISEIEPYFSDFEILVMDDGSTDQTSQTLEQLNHPRVHIHRLARNQGKGFAVREGFRRAVGKYILFIDGGMELHPREIRIFLGLMQLYSADIVLGSKRHPQSKVQYPWIRRALSGVFQAIIAALFEIDVTDTQVGLKLFRRDVIDRILPELVIDRYGFDLELLVLAKKHGFRTFLEAPIQLDYFSFNSRGRLGEIRHIFKVGSRVLADTWKLYRRMGKER